MECSNCEQTQRQFFCAKCLQTHVRELRLRMLHFGTDRDDQVAKSIRALHAVQRNRSVRADITAAQDRLEELADGLAKLRRDNDSKRERLRSLRESHSTRQQNLASAKSLRTSLNQTLIREQHEQQSLSGVLARARSGLVKELVEVFNVSEQHTTNRPGGNQVKAPEWTIGDLVLPVPGDIRRYPPDHINAVITHTIHFLSLLTFYLGVKLPFEISWSGTKFGVGAPWIGAIRGGEAGGWAKWYTKHALHLSATPAPALSPSASSTSSSAELISESVDLLPPPPPLSPQPSSSSSRPFSSSTSSPYYHTRPTTAPPSTSFSTALAMLIYNTTFLAHSQSIEVPLSHTGNILANLFTVCMSIELGKKSHETRPFLPPPGATSISGGSSGGGFAMEFTQVVQVVSVNPRARLLSAREGVKGKEKGKDKSKGAIKEEEDGWDMVDEEF